jgi:hypothetical protein
LRCLARLDEPELEDTIARMAGEAHEAFSGYVD